MGHSEPTRRGAAKGVHARFRPLLGWLESRPAPGRTLALAIGKRAGKATVRSRVKRILRHAFRQAAPQLPEGARVLIAAGGDMTGMPRRAIRQTATGLLDRLAAQWRSECSSGKASAGRSSRSSGPTN